MTGAREMLRKSVAAVLAIATIYVYLWFAMDVPQLRHDRPRAFQWGMGFLSGFLNYAGGPAAYFHSLLVQLYAFTWAGVAVFTGLFVLTYDGARRVLSAYYDRPTRLIPLFTAGLGLILVNSRMTLVPIMGLATSLYASWLYARIPIKHCAARLLLFLAAASILYYTFAGAFLLLVTLCSLHECFARRWRLAGVAILLGALVPVATRYWSYEPDLLALYFRNAPMEEKTKSLEAVTVVRYMCAWLSVPITVLARPAGRQLNMADRLLFCKSMSARVILVIVIAGTLAVPPILRTRFCQWTVAERLIDEGQWEEALTCMGRLPESNVLVSHMANWALFHTGRLLDEMFKYPQYAKPELLLLDGNSMDGVPRAFDKRSRVYLELGMMSRAERWTLEAISITGELPSLAKRMVTISIVKGRPGVVRSYLGIIKKTPFQRTWAIGLQRRLQDDPLLQLDPKMRSLRRSMLKVNYADTLTSEELLGLLLANAPGNRMAFEYLATHHLLSREPEKLVQMTTLLGRFGWRRIPRHWEEAILSHGHRTGADVTQVGLFAMSSDTVARYARFLEASRKKTRELLRAEFGDTYWYFEMFGRSGIADDPRLRGKVSTSQGNRLDGGLDLWHQGRE